MAPRVVILGVLLWLTLMAACIFEIGKAMDLWT